MASARGVVLGCARIAFVSRARLTTARSAYRELVWLARRARAEERRRLEDVVADVARRARAARGANATAADVADGVRRLVGTVGYARAMTSRVGRRRFEWDEDAREATRVVERTGGKSGRERVANGVLSREDAWAYHNRLIDRQHFGRRLRKFKPEPL